MVHAKTPPDDADAGPAPGAGRERPQRPWWRNAEDEGEPDVDPGAQEIDVRAMAPEYAAREDLFEAVRRIKDRLLRASRDAEA
ncbi:MAG TPA: hypothetical protein PK042_10815 [Usitatibacteraceae bacterium]|nr:hypothetical protein [Usitatibacteraceae bacterium]